MSTSNYQGNKILNDYFRDALNSKVSGSTDFTGARTFETGTTAPPTDKCLRYNNATMASVTAIYIDNTNTEGTDEATELATFSGYIIITDSSDTSVYQVFMVNSFAPQSGYGEYNVTFKYGSATKPTDRVTLADFSCPWLGLSTAVMTGASTGATASEPATADGYARQPIFLGTDYWTLSTAQSTDSKTDIAFVQSSDAWGTIQSVFIADSSTRAAGNIKYYTILDPSLIVQNNTIVTFLAGSLTVSLP